MLNGAICSVPTGFPWHSAGDMQTLTKAEKHLTICCLSLHVQCVEHGNRKTPDSFNTADIRFSVLQPDMPLEKSMVDGPHWGKIQSSFWSHINKYALGCCSFHAILTLFQQLQNIWTEIHDLLKQVFIILLKCWPLNAVCKNNERYHAAGLCCNTLNWSWQVSVMTA